MRKSIIICLLLLLCIRVNARNTLCLTKNFSNTFLIIPHKGDAMLLNNRSNCYDCANGMSQYLENEFQGLVLISHKRAVACFANGDLEKGVGLLKETVVEYPEFSPALWQLAKCYHYGLGTAKDMAKALDLYKKCEIKEFPSLESLYLNIASIYEAGIDGSPDYRNAFQYWIKLAEAGGKYSIVAEYKVGEYYYRGLGMEKNLSEAVSWLTKAYENNYLGACKFLADCYFYGKGVEQSYKKAFEIFQKGANNDSYCLYKIGVMYRDGLGVTADKKRGKELLMEAAEKGVGSAQYLLGMDMYNGENVSRNYKEAVRYFELALKDQCLLNEERSAIMRKLSACFRFGRGVAVDMEKADYYIKEAARYGDADAQNLQEYFHTK